MEQQVHDARHTKSLVALYKQVFPLVAALVKRYGGGEDDARDVFHDALLIWLEKPPAEHLEVVSEPAYIATIARNEWFRRVEKAEKQKNLHLEPVDGEEPRVSRELYDFLVQAGKKCMDLLQAFYYEQLSAAQIAARFGFSGGHSASAQKYKCLEKLRGLVKARQRRKEDFYEN